MYEDLEETMAQLALSMSPEQRERYGPALQELGLAVAEQRQAERELERNRQRTLVDRVFGLKRSQDDLDRSREHFYNALVLLSEAE
jgi:hypothetical protein